MLSAFCGEDPDQHVGVDVLAHFQGLAEACMSEWTLEEKMVDIFSRTALSTMYCRRHNDGCGFRHCSIDISGFPCVDYSPSGNQLGVNGPTFPVLLALCSWHRQRGTEVVLLENVPEFPIQVLTCLMGDMYEIYPFYLEPADAGADYLSRMRVFVLLVRKGD